MSFYKQLTEDRKDTPELKSCIVETIEKLNVQPANDENPGLLLGYIQSGKTRAFIGVIAKAFDEGFQVAVVLTKGTKALAIQTYKRLEDDFEESIEKDYMNVYDIMEMPNNLTSYQLNQYLIFVVKKEDDNLKRLHKTFFETYPTLKDRKTIIIDDEGDQASVSFRRDSDKEDGVEYGVLAKLLSSFRNKLTGENKYLQVTATPYSLYLQPDEIVINNQGYAPVKPSFTTILPPFKGYIGGEFYFEESQNPESYASDIFSQVCEKGIEVLQKSRKEYLSSFMTSANLQDYRNALLTYLCAGAIRIMQDKIEEDEFQLAGFKRKYKTACLVHTGVGIATHNWQALLADLIINDGYKIYAINDNIDYITELNQIYDRLIQSVKKANLEVPSFNDVKNCIKEAFEKGEVGITRVNSQERIGPLLNKSGQLSLNNPFNIFIGANVLDRGITIDHLICFFYGRNPKRFQMDTVLQHSRMYGNRSKEDLAVTRFYTTARIYDAMKNMHFFDSALRRSVEQDRKMRVRFIRKTQDGSVIPSGPNKLAISNLITVKPNSRHLPYGFQTIAKSYLAKKTQEIDELIGYEPDKNFPLTLSRVDAIKIIDIINSTFTYEPQFENEGYEWDILGFKSLLKFLIRQAKRDDILTLVRANRNISWKKDNGRSFSDAPDDGKTDNVEAKQLAIDKPILFLFRQNGIEKKGWRGAPFYWPVLYAQNNIDVHIFNEE